MMTSTRRSRSRPSSLAKPLTHNDDVMFLEHCIGKRIKKTRKKKPPFLFSPKKEPREEDVEELRPQGTDGSEEGVRADGRKKEAGPGRKRKEGDGITQPLAATPPQTETTTRRSTRKRAQEEEEGVQFLEQCLGRKRNKTAQPKEEPRDEVVEEILPQSRKTSEEMEEEGDTHQATPQVVQTEEMVENGKPAHLNFLQDFLDTEVGLHFTPSRAGRAVGEKKDPGIKRKKLSDGVGPCPCKSRATRVLKDGSKIEISCPFCCKFCSFWSKSERKLGDHTGTAHPFTCILGNCCTNFTSQAELEIHSYTVHEPKNVCSTCQRVFRSTQSFNAHTRTKIHRSHCLAERRGAHYVQRRFNLDIPSLPSPPSLLEEVKDKLPPALLEERRGVRFHGSDLIDKLYQTRGQRSLIQGVGLEPRGKIRTPFGTPFVTPGRPNPTHRRSKRRAAAGKDPDGEEDRRGEMVAPPLHEEARAVMDTLPVTFSPNSRSLACQLIFRPYDPSMLATSSERTPGESVEETSASVLVEGQPGCQMMVEDEASGVHEGITGYQPNLDLVPGDSPYGEQRLSTHIESVLSVDEDLFVSRNPSAAEEAECGDGEMGGGESLAELTVGAEWSKMDTPPHPGCSTYEEVDIFGGPGYAGMAEGGSLGFLPGFLSRI